MLFKLLDIKTVLFNIIVFFNIIVLFGCLIGINANNIFIKNYDRVCNVLSFSGGGSFGAVEVGILKGIMPNSNYDIITGISAGALNAGLLSYFNTGKLDDFNKGINFLINTYTNLKTPDVYNRDILDIRKEWSYYSTAPLRKTINNITSSLTYYPDYKNQITLIGSTNINTGVLDIFNINQYSKSDLTEILMASSAIPFVFPPNNINSSTYVDGGVVSNQILIGLNKKIKCEYYNITYITPTKTLYPINSIDSFSDYTKRLIKVLKASFDDQFSILKGLKCEKPTGKIYYYYSDDAILNKYSILDMDHGAELIEIGSKYINLETFDYCL